PVPGRTAVRPAEGGRVAEAFARGAPVAWLLARGQEDLRVTWAERGGDWPARLGRTAVLVVLGLLGVWWTRRLGAAAWPEQLVLVGLAAWAAEGEPVLSVLPAAGVPVRAVVVARGL